MHKTKNHQRRLSVKDGEFIFEQWAKFLTINLLDDLDILNEPKATSRTIENVTAEMLRCVFSQGYRFAMLQVMQQSKKIHALQENEDLDDDELKKLLELIEEQKYFISEKIEDSFMLQRTDGKVGMTLSRKLRNEFDDQLSRDYLRWGSVD